MNAMNLARSFTESNSAYLLTNVSVKETGQDYTWRSSSLKNNVKFTLEQDIKAQRESRGIALLFR